MRKLPRSRRMWVLWLLLAVVLVSWIGSPIWGNPLVRLSLKGRVMDYLAEQYPAERFTYVGSTYDFLNHRYVVKMIPAATPGLTVRLTSGSGAIWRDDYRRTRLESDLRHQAEPLIKAVMPEARVSATAPGDANQEASLSVSWQSPGASAEAFVAEVRTMLDALLRGGQMASSYHFWCEIGDREYSLMLTAEQAHLGPEELLPLVARPGKW